MFVGRQSELESLETAYQKGSFQFAVVYGRRRVGKTSLLRAFTQDKPSVIFFTGQQTVASENLALLSREMLGDSAAGAAFPSIQVALESVFERAKAEQVILVIDEYPYLAESDPGVSSCLQTLIDRHKDKSNLFLVLCGSSMSFMEHQVLGHQSPLYGRRAMQLRIDPFVVFDVAQMLPDHPSRELSSCIPLSAACRSIYRSLIARAPRNGTLSTLCCAKMRFCTPSPRTICCRKSEARLSTMAS